MLFGGKIKLWAVNGIACVSLWQLLYSSPLYIFRMLIQLLVRSFILFASSCRHHWISNAIHTNVRVKRECHINSTNVNKAEKLSQIFWSKSRKNSLQHSLMHLWNLKVFYSIFFSSFCPCIATTPLLVQLIWCLLLYMHILRLMSSLRINLMFSLAKNSIFLLVDVEFYKHPQAFFT